jgi:radical SAM superfamily enzyme
MLEYHRLLTEVVVIGLRGTDPDIVQNDVEDLLSAVLVPYDIWIGAAVGVGFLTAYTSISSPLHKGIHLLCILCLIPTKLLLKLTGKQN